LESELQKTAMSLRALTSAEQNSIEVYITRIVQANKNETVEELSGGTNNAVNTKIIFIMNGLEEKAKLNEKQSLKVIMKEKYF
jgi:predicted Zn-dependent protease